MTKRILVVDDDASIRESVGEVLESEGYGILLAENGQIAIDLLKKSHSDQLPGMIILDLMMPVMDGHTFLKIVESDYAKSFGKVPIVVASANGNLMSTSGLHFASDKLKKPFDIDQLIGMAKKHCGNP